METTVRAVAVGSAAYRTISGITPQDRRAARPRKLMINQGTSRFREKPDVPSEWVPRTMTDNRITTGPSMSTRTSFTRVPSWVLTIPTGTVAAST